MSKKKSNVTKVRNIKPIKNVSKTIKNGAVIQTRDHYLYGSGGYVKPKYADVPDIMYRQGVVVDSNINDDLAIILIQSGGKLKAKNKKGQTEKFGSHIKIRDDENQPIRINNKFKRGKPQNDFSAKRAKRMKNKALKTKSKRLNKSNLKKILELKK